MQDVITVHHLNNSRSQRVLWLLEELGVPYEIIKYERDPKTLLAPKSLEAIHPLGKSPVITDDSGGTTKTIAESGAILEYLIETYGKGRLAPAPGTPASIDYRYFMHYAEGSLMPYLLLKLVFRKVKTAPVPFFVKPIAKGIANKVSAQFIDPNLTRHLAFLNDHLGKHTWFAGDELTGLITATALVRPSKSVHEVDAKSVRKKMKDKAFARGVSREDVTLGARELGVDLDEHIQFVIDAMKASADELGLAGTGAAAEARTGVD